MAIHNIIQPEIIVIDSNIRLRKYSDDCMFALKWYQDIDTVMLVDGVSVPYSIEKLYRMYHYLEQNMEVYFIEVKENNKYIPIGDVSFSPFDMPIVIGNKNYRNKGIGTKVIKALILRARALKFSSLEIREIYDYNEGSKKLFEKLGFKAVKTTSKGKSYRLEF